MTGRQDNQKNNATLLDRIFRNPEIKYSFRIFEAHELERLELDEKDGEVFVKCVLTGNKRLAKPEEIIRQLTICKLINDLNYPKERISIEVPIKVGRGYDSKRADIVVYKEDAKEKQGRKDGRTPYIIIEVKKPLLQDGLEQLRSYMNVTGAPYGAWINGQDAVYLLRKKSNIFEELPRLPALNETVDDVKKPITKNQLKPIHNLKAEVQDLINTVFANAGVSAFEEIFKLIFAKLYDEFSKGDGEAMEFHITTAPPKEQYERLKGLFKRACEKWPGIFPPNEKVKLSPNALITVASTLQTKKFLDADLDVIDAAFEHMINPEQKGDKGQYFTPRPVVKMCVKMLNPKPEERVLDPACGPGGFLIHTLHWVFERYLKPRFGNDLPRQKIEYANTRLFGIDFDERLTRVAKAMMLIAGDGRSNIYHVNALDEGEWENRTDGLKDAIKDGHFDIVMTNPPFAGVISKPEILGKFDLAYKGDPTKHKQVNKLTRDLLFLERCLRFLKPGGRMAIVLPQGVLNNTNTEYVRAWLLNKARILAVVGLHVNTFKPFTGTKTSVLFLRKWGEDEEPIQDYPIFLAVNEKPIKDNSGNYIFKKNHDGSYATDQQGKRIIDHDLDDIAEEFIKFAQEQGEQGFDFWRD